MVGKTQRISTEDFDDPEALEEMDALELAELAEENALRSAIAQLVGDSSAKLHIYSLNEQSKGGAGIYLECFPADDYTYDEILNRLRDKHRGGDFKIQLRNKAGHIKATQMISVAKQPDIEDSAPEHDNIAAIINAVKEDKTNNDNILAVLMEQNRLHSEAMARASQENMSVMASMIQAIASREPPPPPQQLGATEIIAMMTGMQALQPKVADPMDIFMKGADFGQNAGTSGDENVLQTAIKTLGGPIASMAQSQQAPAKQPLPPQHPQHKNTVEPKPLAPVVEAPTPPNESENDMNMHDFLQWKPHIDTLIGAAMRSANVELYAELLVDQVGAHAVSTVVTNDEHYEKIFFYVPATQKYRPWFDQLRGVILEWIKELDAVPNASEEQNRVPEQTQNTPDIPDPAQPTPSE